MSKITVIDYDAGNTMSVMNALKFLGYDVTLSKEPKELFVADHIIFPGVGAYADAMNKLKEYGLIGPIKEIINKKIPFLGICLGMQLLFESSTENAADLGIDRIEGLGILDGNITEFRENEFFLENSKTSVYDKEAVCSNNSETSLMKGGAEAFEKTILKVPHMGWNSLEICSKNSRLFNGIEDGSFVYFVHSYFLNAKHRKDVAARTEYGTYFDSAVECENIFGCQFHPEKSGDVGMEILKNFCNI